MPDVNLEDATLTARQALHRVRGVGLQPSAPKTLASAATIPLTSAAVAALRAHRTHQLEQRLRVGTTTWEKTGYVFTTELGTRSLRQTSIGATSSPSRRRLAFRSAGSLTERAVPTSTDSAMAV